MLIKKKKKKQQQLKKNTLIKTMIKTFIVDKTDVNMRIDRLLRSKLGKIPQSLIEKSLRNGKIKLNKKKVKSSYKVNSNDKIELFNFDFKEEIIQK